MGTGDSIILTNAALGLMEAVEKKCEAYAEERDKALFELQFVTSERDLLKKLCAKQQLIIDQYDKVNRELQQENEHLLIRLHTPIPLYPSNHADK